MVELPAEMLTKTLTSMEVSKLKEEEGQFHSDTIHVFQQGNLHSFVNVGLQHLADDVCEGRFGFEVLSIDGQEGTPRFSTIDLRRHQLEVQTGSDHFRSVPFRQFRADPIRVLTQDFIQ
ncbi:hypothetical protein WICPIJ_000135 [Wickerhamomyces pijperi]|uniref:Uncharacterized protein n=1 Tax=Wickerhamomyces pijperi TaxID=599730 RepID=A0A9P8QHB0_WICPI|nr:hypothetical protein WICPIJ_000135 [Wickerhamomyces pijperi]